MDALTVAQLVEMKTAYQEDAVHIVAVVTKLRGGNLQDEYVMSPLCCGLLLHFPNTLPSRSSMIGSHMRQSIVPGRSVLRR